MHAIVLRQPKAKCQKDLFRLHIFKKKNWMSITIATNINLKKWETMANQELCICGNGVNYKCIPNYPHPN